ncbi:hypothetical protein [uncultured Microbacterium sp.]|uniref:hypothetical protein n=1 Tax=uncultured Microbacterium sp. TaxID=191216 RepID=UPI0028E416D3|nr:hypothetical protein [uncultured Microbacterium sp.]
MMNTPNDPVFRALADGLQAHTMWRIGLVDMWDEIERTVLKRPVRFLTEQQREAMLP